MLIYIENKMLAAKIITYLDYLKKDYTLDLYATYEYILIAQLNQKTLELIKGKKVIFITYLIEEKLHNIFSKNNKRICDYRNLIINRFNSFYKIIVSLDSIKSLLNNIINTDIEVINKELPFIINNPKDIYIKYNIKKRRKSILFIDFNYDCLEEIYNLSKENKKLNFIYLGFKPYYELTNKKKKIYDKLDVIKVKYYDINIFNDLLKITSIVINTSNIFLDIDYLYLILIFNKIFLTKQNIYYDNYLINSKHIYIFDNMKELKIKFDKILTERIQNLTDNAYEVIKDNYFTAIANKYSIYLE